ncbi:PAS domain S-box-containing protein [Streptomyces sp. TLI_053]|uniref:PP2C family protein-serine/threonine phosphatase n=1 Tax=Streptomyces sp. TLI_053 TaxID=1855352 RepID=UPI00087CBB81|nr:SpoIIE family protein phosphatase [Streptomyces sp. TLI_053]SDT82855.1 PAS domain S-box-containing protein [Streptomyces sp. TLI_053]
MTDGPRPGGPPGVPPYGAGPTGPAGGPGEAQDAVARQLAGAVRRLQHAVERMRAEEGTRALVDLATGMLAERLTSTTAEAAARLAALAREAGVPVATLAADVVGRTAEGPARDGGPGPSDRRGAPGSAGAPAPPAPARALAAVPDLAGAVEAVLRQGAAPLGAHAVLVWQRLPGGGLALAAQAGLPLDEAEAWNRVPPGVDTPARQAVTGGEDRWPDAPAPTGPVAGGATTPRAVLPLLADGRRLGALEVLWPGPAPELGPPQRRRLRALADLCATLLGHPEPPVPPDREADLLDGVLDPALLLEPVLRDGRVVDFTVLRTNRLFRDPLGRPRSGLDGTSLLETYPMACATGLLEPLLRAHETGEPRTDDRLRLVFQGGGIAVPAVLRIAVAPLGPRLLLSWQRDTDRSGDPEQTDLLRQAQRLARVAGFEEQPDSGRILWSEGLSELFGLPPESAVPLARLARHVHPDDGPAVRRLLDTVRHRLRTASSVFRLVRPDGSQRYTRVIAEPVLDEAGRLVAIRGAYHDVSAQHWTEIALGATRARLADSEQETAEREQLALRLQQAILPAAPPPLGASGLRAAVRYRPAAKRERVGGDWYDVLVLPDRRVLLAVGDVAGHGVGAATGMVALRHALRGLAVTGAGPGRLLEWANTVALREPAQVTATAVCVLLGPDDGSLRWARAGHLPPIRLAPGGAEVLPLPHGVLLGALADAEYEEYTARLVPGDVLLLYTDGLVERRDRPVEESVDQLIRAAGPPGPDLERYLDLLLELSPADTDDDTCLVAVRIEPPEAAAGPPPDG